MPECDCEQCHELRRHMDNLPETERTEAELEMWASYRGPRLVMLTASRFRSTDEALSYFWIARRMGGMELM